MPGNSGVRRVKTPFLGTAYTSRSKDLADQRCINIYPETVETKSGAEVGAFYGCPGTILQFSVGGGPVRAMLVFGAYLFVVSGNGVYRVDPTLTATLLGTIGTSSGLVSMISNPTQVALFDGSAGYVYNGVTFAAVALPFSNPVSAVYQDGFGLVSQGGTFNIWQSGLNDLTIWNALNFSKEDGSSDQVVGLAEFHRQIVVFKERHIAFWVNAGNAGFAFQRLDGVYLQTGCVAPASIASIDEALLWLGRREEGQGQVFMAKGYDPQVVSTYAIDNTLLGYARISDAIGFTYQQGGHNFYVLNFPTGGETWALDLSETKKMGFPVWHQRAGFLNGNFTSYEPACQASFAGKVLVGSGTGGNVYALDLDTFTDNGAARKWLRSWRALLQSDRASERYNFLELEYESGIGVSPGANPQFMLRYSDDAHNWSNQQLASAGRTGETTAQARFNRLGISRRGANTDRVFELSSTDPFKVALMGAEVG